jgi:hypothetical protein
MPDKTAAALNRAAARAFKPIPARMRNTLALDNDKEFTAHRSLPQTLATGLSNSACLKKYRLIRSSKNSVTKSLIKSIIGLVKF